MSAAFLLDRASYYILFLLLITALAVYRLTMKKVAASPARFLSENRSAAIAALLLTVFVFLTVPIGFKVLSDDAIYLGISRSMAFERSTVIPYGEVFIDSPYAPVVTEHAKRPLLFPFLVHLFHVTGYRMANAFAVNFLVLFGLLFVVFRETRARFDSLTALSATLLILAQPIVPLSAASAGTELLACLLLILGLLSLHRYLERPTAESLLLLWVQSLLLIYARYECLVYVGIFTAAILLSRAPWRDNLRRYPAFYLLTPLFFVPWIAQRIVKGDLSLIQRNADGVEFLVFGFRYFEQHLKELFTKAIEMREFLPYSYLLVGAGLTVCLAYPYLRKRVSFERSDGILLRTIGVCLAANLFIFFFFSGGSVARPSAARYFLVACVFLALTPLFLKNAFRIPSVIFLIVSTIAFGASFPKTIKNEALGSLVEIRATEAINDFLNKVPKNEILLICEKPHHFTVDGISAVSFAFAQEKPEAIVDLLRSRKFSDVLVAHRIDTPPGTISKGQILPPSLPLEALGERPISPWNHIVLSKVKIP